MTDDDIIFRWHDGDTLTDEESARLTAIQEMVLEDQRKPRRVRRSTTTGTERMRKTRATLAERGLTRLDVTISQETLAEIDRRADAIRTSRGEIIAQAIEATRDI